MRSLLAPLTLLLAAGLAFPARAQWSAIEVPVSSGPAVTPKVATARPAAAGQPAPAVKGEPQPISGALTNLLRLRPVRYAYPAGQGETGPQYGLRPAELAKVFPELVRTDLMTGQQTVNTGQLLPLLVEALKEQQQQLAQLQAQQQQLAQAYAALVRQQPPTGPLALLRRPRVVTAGTDSTTIQP